MKLKCNLSSISTLRLLSYFIPEKFEFDYLQKIPISDSMGAFLSFLKKDIHTYDIHCYDRTVEVDIPDVTEDDFIDNFGEDLTVLRVKEFLIDFDSELSLSFKTDDTTYENSRLINFKIDKNGKLIGLMGILDGINDYIIFDINNQVICIISKNKKALCDKLFNKL